LDNFYKRQICLNEVGEKGQLKLTNARVLVIGAGGLGCPALQYLAASGVGSIGICDHDQVDYTNLHRQILFTPSDVGHYKAEISAKRVSQQNPLINVDVFLEKLTSQNVKSIFKNYDIIVDCTDNFKAKFLIHDSCYLLKKDLIQSSIYQFEGQLQTFNFSNDEKRNDGCFRCLWPKMPEANCVGSCEDSGVLGVVPGVLGSLQANEVIKLILGLPNLTQRQTLTFDLRNMQTSKIKWKKKTDCPLCSKRATINKIDAKTYLNLRPFEISSSDIDLNSVLVNILPKSEDLGFWTNKNIRHIHHIEAKELDKIQKMCEENEKVTFVCMKGHRSYALVEKMRGLGYSNCFSLAGGRGEI